VYRNTHVSRKVNHLEWVKVEWNQCWFLSLIGSAILRSVSGIELNTDWNRHRPERSLRDDTAGFYVIRESDTPPVDLKCGHWNYVANELFEATTFVIRKILKFIKIITRSEGKLKTFEFLKNITMRL